MSEPYKVQIQEFEALVNIHIVKETCTKQNVTCTILPSHEFPLGNLITIQQALFSNIRTKSQPAAVAVDLLSTSKKIKKFLKPKISVNPSLKVLLGATKHELRMARRKIETDTIQRLKDQHQQELQHMANWFSEKDHQTMDVIDSLKKQVTEKNAIILNMEERQVPLFQELNDQRATIHQLLIEKEGLEEDIQRRNQFEVWDGQVSAPSVGHITMSESDVEDEPLEYDPWNQVEMINEDSNDLPPPIWPPLSESHKIFDLNIINI